jgi:MoCo/4Fe-4S cofactor protein with predicted Tat translocation signal
MSETGTPKPSGQNLNNTQPLDQGRREANMANETIHGEGQNKQALTLDAARAKLAGQTGKTYWRSVDELADTPAFREMVQREFPAQAAEWIDPVSRRGFLKVMGASLALAGLSGCTKQPDEAIYPYVKEPEDLVLGRPVYFASAMPFNTGAVPVLVKSDAYRPIKVDGNPDHPVNRGSSDPLTQGSLLDLYDPDRSQRVIYRGEVREFAAFLAVFRAMLADKKASGGAGLYILSDTVTSPRNGKRRSRNIPTPSGCSGTRSTVIRPIRPRRRLSAITTTPSTGCRMQM